MTAYRSASKKLVAAWPVPHHTAVTRLLAGATLLCIFANAHAQSIITGANAKGDAVYDLILSPSPTVPTTPVISGTTPVNSAADAKSHGSFDALVWVQNTFCQTSDLIAADATHGQIVRYAGASTVRTTPCNNTATVSPTAQPIFSWSKSNPGPAQPNGLSVDAFGNLFVVSSSGLFDPKPSVWVLPFNPSTGNYGKPVLIDNNFGGALTLALSETLVAGVQAKTSPATILWSAGDLLVLVGDSFDARLTVYSQTAIYGSSTNGTITTHGLPLKGPSSIAIPFLKFLQVLAAPFGMDLWPANATLGTNASVLFTTIDGRILRFDTVQNKFVTNFAGGLGQGLQKLKVATYGGTPYAFVAQGRVGSSGRILEFGAPSGTSVPLSAFGTGIMNPVGLAVQSAVPPPYPSTEQVNPLPSGSGCPNGVCTIDPLGPLLSTMYEPSAGNNLQGPITESYCLVQNDPRVSATITGGVLTNWSCTGAALPIGAGTNICPAYPAAVIPGSVCGHSGATASGFVVVEGEAKNFDPFDNNTFFQSPNNVDTVLPGPGNLECPNFATTGIPLAAWGTRSDEAMYEGTIPEDTSDFLYYASGFGASFDQSLAGQPGFLMESTIACDNNTSGGHGISIFALGLGTSSNSVASGATTPNPLYVAEVAEEKYAAILDTLQSGTGNNFSAGPPLVGIAPSADTTGLQRSVDFAFGFVSQIVAAGATPGSITTNVPCALNEIYNAATFNRGNLSNYGSNLTNPYVDADDTDFAGDFDTRLGAWYVALNTELAGQATPTWPIPAPGSTTCSSISTAPVGMLAFNQYQGYLSWIADHANSCTLTSNDDPQSYNMTPVPCGEQTPGTTSPPESSVIYPQACYGPVTYTLQGFDDDNNLLGSASTIVPSGANCESE